jgi:hypothetical protein
MSSRPRNKAYKEVFIKDWNDVHSLSFIRNETWLYRGQPAKFIFKSSIERALESFGVKHDYWLSKEYYALKEFKQRAHLYASHLPEAGDLASWLSLMQHHGTPTRLVDFTYSFFVAAYFALIDDSKEPSVWAIEDHWIRCAGSDLAARLHNSRGNSDLREDQLGRQYTAANKHLADMHLNHKGGLPLENDATRGVFMIEPEVQTQRLAVQQGLFLMPLNLQVSFLKNLGALRELSDEGSTGPALNTHVKKLVFSREARSRGLRQLKEMNITAESLFPGLDGFAASLKHTIIAL